MDIGFWNAANSGNACELAANIDWTLCSHGSFSEAWSCLRSDGLFFSIGCLFLFRGILPHLAYGHMILPKSTLSRKESYETLQSQSLARSTPQYGGGCAGAWWRLCKLAASTFSGEIIGLSDPDPKLNHAIAPLKRVQKPPPECLPLTF